MLDMVVGVFSCLFFVNFLSVVLIVVGILRNLILLFRKVVMVVLLIVLRIVGVFLFVVMVFMVNFKVGNWIGFGCLNVSVFRVVRFRCWMGVVICIG